MILTIADAVQVLAACLCEKLTESDAAPVCYCGVLPGDAVAVDIGTCDDDGVGMAYVRLVTTYPSNVVGQQFTLPGNCGAGKGFDVELGIYRPFPLDPNGSPLPETDFLAASLAQYADEKIMQQALSCGCWLPNGDFVVGQYAPSGPAGGVLGGTIPVSAWIA